MTDLPSHEVRLPACLALIALAACAPGVDSGAEQSGAGAPATGAPSREELRAATYSGHEAGTVTLTDGKWDGEPYMEGGASRPALWLSDPFYLSGDLDGDGADEAVAHLTFSAGGTGNFGYLAVVGRTATGVGQLGIAEIGDRVAIRGARIEAGSIVLDVLQAGPDDGMCCPTELATRTFTLEAGELTETSTEILGTAGLDTLDGTNWSLRGLSSTEPAPSSPEVTLAFAGDTISGNSGCNDFSGTVGETDMPKSLSVGPLRVTRKACPDEVMSLEQQVLAAIQGAETWGVLFGDLVVTYRVDETWGSLFFSPR